MCNPNLSDFFVESCDNLNLPFQPEAVALLAVFASKKAKVNGKLPMMIGLTFKPEVKFWICSPEVHKDTIVIVAEKRLDHTQVRFTFERNFDHEFLTIY